MKYKAIKKWSLSILLILISISIVSCIGVKSQINQHLGKKTERVDPLIFNTPSSPLAIKNVSVLSTDSASMIDSLTVLMRNGIIESISKDIVISSEYKIINGTGKYLIPGLIDTHVHLKKSKNDLLLYLANGVTSIGEMTGTKKHLEWRKEAKNGTLSPYIFVATNKIGSTPGLIKKFKSWFAGRKNFSTENKARRAVRRYKEQGYDALKLSSFLSPKIYKAIIDEAKKQNIPAIGHLSLEVGLNNFYTSGQSQLAHVEEIIKNTMEDYTGIVYNTPEDYLNYLDKNKDSIAIKIRENNITVTSTLWVSESFPKQKFDLESFIKTIELEYANSGLVEGSRMSKGYLPGNNSYENLEIKNDPERTIKSKIFWETYAKAIQIMTKTLIENNVNIITGTDANVACVVPGFSLHDELESLSKIGLNNTQILNAATLASAKWMGLNSGQVKIGSKADLVLLEKNPLEDIRNTRSINSVITNGKFLNRTTIDKMLQSIKEANNKSRKINIDRFID